MTAYTLMRPLTCSERCACPSTLSQVVRRTLTDSDGDDEAKDESEEDDDVDEEALINTLGEEEREKYDGVVEDEEKRGWGSYSPITVQPFASPPMAVPVLNGCTTPLHFFHALLPLTFFDHVTDRTNIYAMARHGPGKENTPPSLSTRARAAEEEEAGAGWTPTSSEEILALVGTFTARKKRGRPSLQPKLAADEVHHIPQLRAKDQVCTVCSKTMRRSQGKHKPRTREGCGTCGVAVHFACWKEHLPHEEEDEEGGEE